MSFRFLGDIVKINPQNNGFIGWAEFLEIIRDFGKRDPEEYYVIDILGPIYSIIHSAQDSGFSEKTINTSSLRPIPIDEELFINNTEYVEDMLDYRWKPLSSEL